MRGGAGGEDMSDFAHLHLHTEYSLLDGLGRINDYMARAREFGMRHVAITDHGVMYGVLDWYKAARANDLNPVIGVEAYLAKKTIDDHSDRSPYHMVLLAENETGYRNLLKLSSKASLEGFYYRPRIDLDMLNEHREGLICTSACLQGPLAANFLNDNPDGAEHMGRRLREIFGPDRFYVEIQDHGIPEQKKVLPQLIGFAKAHDLPIVAANDVHYLNADDAAIQELLVCIQTNRTLNDPNRMKMSTDQLYFKSGAEMASLFGDVPGAIENSVRIAERCAFDLDFGRLHLPEPEIPDGMTAQEYLAHLCWEGLPGRYGEATEEIRSRLEYELYVIEQTGFPSYLLIVRDFAMFARERAIPFGVRGSAAASIVLYTLGITDIDPIENRLVFERFLNLERREMPDIDMDFADNRRAEVIDYVAQKYGHDRVAQIVTFGTMGAKASLRDTGRAMGWPLSDVDRVARLIPQALNMTLERALAESTELRNLYSDEPQVQDLVDRAQRLEGIARHSGTHAAGIVISRDPLVDHLPLQRPARGSDENSLPTTQFTMETVAEIGLLKMDFLGLANLTILGEAVDIVRQTRGVDLDPKAFPDGDEKTYKMLAAGETFGVFQLESAGMRRYIQELRPGSISELSAMVALYRPGPMQHIPRFCRAKHGLEEIQLPHPDLADILDETYGVIVYQDQVLLIAQRFAGYTLGEADIMRKAMGKKIPEKMRAERERFLRGAQEKGYSKADGQKIFDLIEPFAGYAFNKAHAVCYGTISYQTAYLKANYPAEYMAAVLRLAASHPSGPAVRVAAAVAECQKQQIPVLKPDINRSDVQFTVESLDDGYPAVRFGLAIVKNVGESAVRTIVEARQQEPGSMFASLYDLCKAVDSRAVNKRLLESLIKSGAMDEFGQRADLLASLDRVFSAAQSQQKAAQRGQMDLFGGQNVVPVETNTALVTGDPIPKKTLLAWEKDHLGVYLTENPLTELLEAARTSGRVFQTISSMDSDILGEHVQLLVLIRSIRRIVTRTNRTMAIIEIEDLTGVIEAVLFPESYERFSSHLSEDAAVEVRAKVDERNESIQVLVDELRIYEAMEPVVAPKTTPVMLTIESRQTDVQRVATLMTRLAGLIREFPGEDQLYVCMRLTNGERYLRSGLRVDWCSDLQRAIEDLTGEGSVSPISIESTQDQSSMVAD
jgi:DNA polymerase III subunit alpha